MSGDATPRRKLFTLAEAQRLLGEVRTLTERAAEEADRLSAAIQRLSQTDPERVATVEALDAVIAAWTGQVRAMGIQVKGLWLVDFDNGDGYYCWRYPEPAITHYHGYEEGFAGRMKIV